MPAKFCVKCGAKNEYEYEAPKKCKCGFHFADAFKIQANDIPAPKAVRKQIIEEDPIEDDEEYEVVRIKKKKNTNPRKSAAAKTYEELENEEFVEGDEEDAPQAIEESSSEIVASLNESDFLKEIEVPVENLRDIMSKNTPPQ